MSLFTRYGDNEVVSIESAGEKTVDPIRQFYAACESISMEAAEMGSIAGWFVRTGANVSASIQRGFEKLTTYEWAPLTTLYPSNMNSVMRTRDYMEIQSKPVSQPRGFSGNLYEYVMGMSPRIQLACAIRQNVIEPAIKRLGYYLSNPSERGDRRDFPGGASPVAEIGTLIANEVKFFKSDNQATATFGQLFSNNAEFVKAEYQMVEYGKLLAQTPPAAVKASVEQLAAIAGGLFKSLTSERDPASKQLVQVIGKELETVARWVEWYALQITRLTETNAVFAQLEKDLR